MQGPKNTITQNQQEFSRKVGMKLASGISSESARRHLIAHLATTVPRLLREAGIIRGSLVDHEGTHLFFMEGKLRKADGSYLLRMRTLDGRSFHISRPLRLHDG